MKKLSLILLLLIAANSPAQNMDGVNLSIGADEFASTPLRHASLLQSESFNVIFYDSIRILSEINDTTNADAYPWISPDGLHLYYTSGSGGNHIIYSERLAVNAPFSAPLILNNPITVNTSIWLSDDELDAYICSGSSVYYCHRATIGGGFATSTLLTMNGLSASFVGNVSLDSTQTEMYVYGVSGSGFLSIYNRTSATSFDFVRNLTFPPGFAPTPGQLSKDNLTYYASARDNGSKNRLYEFTRASTADTFDVNTIQIIPGTEDTTYQHSQPTTNEDGTILLYSGALVNSWGANELFMATGSLINAIPSAEHNLQINIWPNPTTGIIRLSTENSTNLMIEIFNSIGQCVYSKHSSGTSGNVDIDLSNLPNGVYVCIAGNGNKKSFSKVLLTK